MAANSSCPPTAAGTSLHPALDTPPRFLELWGCRWDWSLGDLAGEAGLSLSKHHVAIIVASLGLLSALPMQALAIDTVHLYVDLQAPGGQRPDCVPNPQ